MKQFDAIEWWSTLYDTNEQRIHETIHSCVLSAKNGEGEAALIALRNALNDVLDALEAWQPLKLECDEQELLSQEAGHLPKYTIRRPPVQGNFDNKYRKTVGMRGMKFSLMRKRALEMLTAKTGIPARYWRIGDSRNCGVERWAYDAECKSEPVGCSVQCDWTKAQTVEVAWPSDKAVRTEMDIVRTDDLYDRYSHKRQTYPYGSSVPKWIAITDTTIISQYEAWTRVYERIEYAIEEVKQIGKVYAGKLPTGRDAVLYGNLPKCAKKAKEGCSVALEWLRYWIAVYDKHGKFVAKGYRKLAE